MAALRKLVPCVAVTGVGGPAAALTTVDTALPTLAIAGTATAVVVHASREPDGWTLTWSSAGHLPAVLIDPTGRSVQLLDAHPHPLLGAQASAQRQDHTVQAAFGSTLLLYTDRLVERRHEDLDRGLQRLRQAATGEPASAHELLERVMTAMPTSPDDDTAVVVARLL